MRQEKQIGIKRCFLYGEQNSPHVLIQAIDAHDLEGLDAEYSAILLYDYPYKSAVIVRFTEELCRECLAKVRWTEGFVCPKCGGRRYCKLSNGLYQCSDCRRQTSVTAGTFMHRSHVPLTKWFLALYLVTQEKGVFQQCNWHFQSV